MHVMSTESLTVLTLPGNLTSRYAEMLEEYLRRSLDSSGRLIVDCERVTAIDPDCLKILCSAFRLSRTMNKDLVVAGQGLDFLLSVAEQAEHAHCVECGLESGNDCLWAVRPLIPMSMECFAAK